MLVKTLKCDQCGVAEECPLSPWLRVRTEHVGVGEPVKLTDRHFCPNCPPTLEFRKFVSLTSSI